MNIFLISDFLIFRLVLIVVFQFFWIFISNLLVFYKYYMEIGTLFRVNSHVLICCWYYCCCHLCWYLWGTGSLWLWLKFRGCSILIEIGIGIWMGLLLLSCLLFESVQACHSTYLTNYFDHSQQILSYFASKTHPSDNKS